MRVSSILAICLRQVWRGLAIKAVHSSYLPEQPLDDTVATAAKAIDSSPLTTEPVTRLTASTLKKQFIQNGIFNVEKNAKETSEAMRRAESTPQVIQGTSSGKVFWRVIVGPATSTPERANLLKKVKSRGFNDAYFVTN